MKPILCPCRHCKLNRRNWRKVTRHLRKGARSRVRYSLKQGEWEHLPTTIYVGYTDLSKNGYACF